MPPCYTKAPVRWLFVLVALCACGDDLPPDGDRLAPSHDVVIVAHQDDDLYFMQPDLLEAVQSGRGITSVFVTAGNGTGGVDERRYAGLRYAYGAAAGSTNWRCGWITIASHAAEHCRLADRPVSLVFLGYPDGGKDGENAPSLLHLWEGTIPSATTVADVTTTYTRDALIDTLAQILHATRPTVVRTLEVASTHGRDHSDHMIVGALALLAVARANSVVDVISYRGYSIDEEPTNKAPGVLTPVYDMVSYYEACTSKCGSCGGPCTTIEDSHVKWFARRYAVGFRRGLGKLHIDSRCLSSDLQLTACDAAPIWSIDTNGSLGSNDRCMRVAANGEVSLAPCADGSEERFFLDDEGHLWSGVPPAPEADMAYAHLWCLAPTDAGRVRAQLCGRDNAPTWELAPSIVSTSRAAFGFTQTGRAVQLGDVNGDAKADLCTVESGELLCAIGDGTGTFAAATPQAALAIDLQSLTFGDIDNDHRADVCGRDANGILCAAAAQGFVATRWSSSFNDGVARATTSASLAAVDSDADGNVDICGVDATGVVCATSHLAVQPPPRSTWPDGTSPVLLADLDGDHRADWCSATATGPACAIDAERSLTTDGASWAFSEHGVVDAPDAATATIGDIDGDGRADLCWARDDRIVCARSQGHGFGPATTVAIAPPGSTINGVWLGDLDGDGRADVCADTGAVVVCTH